MSGSRMKRLALFTDGTHNETWQCNSYYDVLSQFLSEVCSMCSLLAAFVAKRILNKMMQVSENSSSGN